jgi:hypothetical protein
MMRTYDYGATAQAKINPKMLEDTGYGEFKYMKLGDTGYWKFETEKGRNKFVKDYAGIDAKIAQPFDDALIQFIQTGGMVF